jgi:DNA-binding IclR family transcriptional regulator
VKYSKGIGDIIVTQKLSKANQSVEKTLQIIEVLAGEREPLRLAEISKRVEMPASTVLRMINTLVEHGYAYQDAQSLRYGLTLRFAQIGHMISAQLRIRDVVHPYLTELSRVTGESTCLAIEEDMEVIYIDVVDGGDGMLKIMQRIGKRAPMHSTGVGKLMLTKYSTEKLNQLAEAKGLSVLTPHTLTSIQDLMRELNIVQKQGYAMDDEECVLGARCVAAPIYDFENRIVAAISVSGPVSRITRKRVSELAPMVIEAANKVSEMMAYKGN